PEGSKYFAKPQEDVANLAAMAGIKDHSTIVVMDGVVDDEYPPVRKNSAMIEKLNDIVEAFENDAAAPSKFQWVYKIDDDAYLNFDGMLSFIRTISSDGYNMYGERGTGREEDRDGLQKAGLVKPYCTGGPGYIMSRKTIKDTAAHFKECVHDADTSEYRQYLWHSDSVIGLCIYKHTGAGCWDEGDYYQNRIFRHNLKKEDPFLKKKELSLTIASHPFKDQESMTKQHMRYVQLASQQLEIKTQTPASMTTAVLLSSASEASFDSATISTQIEKPSSMSARESRHQWDVDSKINFMLSELSEEELETAAKASYEYMKNPVPSQRNHFAWRLVERYLTSKKGNVVLALEKIRKTLAFRREIDIEGLITCFDEKSDTSSERKSSLEKHLSSKKFVVQGYDKDGRSTLYFIPRNATGHDVESAIYSIERAIACSKAQDHTINAVVDFSGFSMTKHSPPLEIGKAFLTTLRSHYAGQIHRIYLTDTPFSFSMLWKIFSPFVGTNTRDKIHFANGERNRKKELSKVYDLDQVPSWLVPGGKGSCSIDIDEYLYSLPFDQTIERN
ncbi:MAG: hypothetical protein SGILL_004393, partial [Bacillariaceae sp.]